MMTRARKTAPKSETSFEPKRSQFAPRPFAPKAEEGEGPSSSCCEPRVDFSIADIDIFPRETVQPKMKLGPVGDRYEQEADRVARQVVQTISYSERDSVQRKDGDDEDELDLEEDRMLRRKVAGLEPAAEGSDIGPDLESTIQRARSRGMPLSDRVRRPMERAFGADFGRVRVHTDVQADSLNRSLQARAFTTGNDIFFDHKAYNPNSGAGQELLAHELIHTLQQEASGLAQCKPNIIQRRFEIFKDDITETMTDDEKLEKIVNNFWTSNVKYNAAKSGTKPEAIERGGVEANCRALARAMVEIANDANIKNTKMEELYERNNLLVRPFKVAINSEQLGSLDFGLEDPLWEFDYHVVVKHDENTYDPTFGLKQRDNIFRYHKLKKEEKIHINDEEFTRSTYEDTETATYFGKIGSNWKRFSGFYRNGKDTIPEL